MKTISISLLQQNDAANTNIKSVIAENTVQLKMLPAPSTTHQINQIKL